VTDAKRTDWLGTIVTLLVVLIVVTGTTAWILAAVNARGADNVREVTTVAKCSFQFTAYRSQYSQGSNISLRPVIGPDGKALDPYAGLKLPPAAAISKHLAPNCQKYLVPFTQAAEAAP
jgi:hypothetical protein